MKYFLNIAGVLILVGGLAAGFVGHLGVMSVAFLAFIACLIAANLDRISEFRASAAGVEAKTREVIAKAESTLSELQLLARTVAEVTLSLVKRNGRMGGYSDQEEEKIKTQVLDVLRNLKTSDKDLPHIMEEWDRFTEYDYAMAILGGNTVPDADTEVIEKWQTLRDGGIVKIPSPQEIRKFLEDHGFMTEARSEYIDDYKYYQVHKEHRRRDVWQARREWGRLKKN
jgi:hypothetical protein